MGGICRQGGYDVNILPLILVSFELMFERKKTQQLHLTLKYPDISRCECHEGYILQSQQSNGYASV